MRTKLKCEIKMWCHRMVHPLNTMMQKSQYSQRKTKHSSFNECDQILQSKIERNRVIALRGCELGVLWPHAKIFVPVDLRHVKHEVRNLCAHITLVYAFCKLNTVLLLHVDGNSKRRGESFEARNPTKISWKWLCGSIYGAATIWFVPTSIAKTWILRRVFMKCLLELTGFSKHFHIQNLHRLVFTWMGLILW